MLNIEIIIINKKYDNRCDSTNIDVRARVNDEEYLYRFTKFGGKPKDVPDAFVFAQVLKYIKFGLENPNLD